MKRTLFFILVFTVLIANLVMAKDNPPIMLEGNLGLGGCQGDCSGVDPFLGFGIGGFVEFHKNLSAGLTGRYQKYSIDNGSMYSLMFGLEGRYSFPINHQLNIYGAAGLGYDMLKTSVDTPYGSASGDDSAIFIQFGPGMTYNIDKNISIGGTFRYQINLWNKSSGTFNDWLLAVSLDYRL